MTWSKLFRRAMYTVGHNKNEPDQRCRACTALETQLHFSQCPMLRIGYWDEVIKTLVDIGMKRPQNISSFLTLGKINNGTYIDNNFSGIMFLAWRCLYAETTSAHIENTTANLDKALTRLWSMVVSRLTAYGTRWKKWVETHTGTLQNRGIPEAHRDKTVLYQDIDGHYEIHPDLIAKIPPDKLQEAIRGGGGVRGGGGPGGEAGGEREKGYYLALDRVFLAGV